MAKRKLSREELEKHLSEQVHFLKTSSDLVDSGSEIEFKRLATTIRILVHDTKHSHSLLGQLGMKDMLFFDTSGENSDWNKAPFFGLVQIRIHIRGEGGNTDFVAPLDDRPSDCFSWEPFEDWWSKIVLSDPKAGYALSRKDLVLMAANWDGGAHVDGSIGVAYDTFADGQGLDFFFGDQEGMRPAAEAHRHSVRQIAHEVLRTLEAKEG